MTRYTMLALLPGLLFLAIAPERGAAPQAQGVPALVFVTRHPMPKDAPPGVPGFGPYHRTAVTGGRLMVRRPDGSLYPLIEDGTFLDVSDPTVSWDGKQVAFAATPSPDSPWRIYVVNSDGSDLRAVTRTDRELDLSPLGSAAPRFERYDDIDPCWLPDERICFASTRYPLIAERGDIPATNLFVVDVKGEHVTRVTSERNGAEEPTVDAETGRIVYARWWFNRFHASEVEASGITTDPARAVPSDSVDLWHAVSITPAGDGIKLAGGNPRVRAETMVYQPLVLADGTLIGVRAENLSLVPNGGRLSLEIFSHRFAEPRTLAGTPESGSACSPAALPDGRILFSYDPLGTGDYGLYAVRPDGSRIEKVVDLPGSLELDAAPLAPRRKPFVFPGGLSEFPRALPATEEKQLRDSVTTFRFDCLNVFTNAAVDAPFPDAPPLEHGLKIRFYAALSRPGRAGGDTVVLLREARVDKSGAVHEHELPADTPMFEQLIDAHGHVLRSAMGPAHVPGFNAGRYGSGTKCVGCHIGHSAIPVAVSAHEGKRFNLSPSAEVTASSVAEGNAGGRAVADRRAKGPVQEVAWVARSDRGESVRLSWKSPIEVDTVMIYAISPNPREGTDLRVQECELAFFQDGREVRRDIVRNQISPSGTRVECQGVRVDALEIRPTRINGRVHHRAAVALAEVETIGRLPED